MLFIEPEWSTPPRPAAGPQGTFYASSMCKFFMFDCYILHVSFV